MSVTIKQNSFLIYKTEPAEMKSNIDFKYYAYLGSSVVDRLAKIASDIKVSPNAFIRAYIGYLDLRAMLEMDLLTGDVKESAKDAINFFDDLLAVHKEIWGD